MFKREYLATYIKWGILAALAFCIPMTIFVNAETYRATWLLFLGNTLFLVVIAAYMLSFNRMKGGDASTQTQMAAGHIAAIIGIVLSCIVAAIVLAIAAPQVFSTGVPTERMADAPAQTGSGDTKGMVFFIFMCATIGNVCGGSLVSIILPYTAKRNQTKDRKSEVLNN